MMLTPDKVTISWPDGSVDEWCGVRVQDIKTEDPDTRAPIEYLTMVLPLGKRSAHSPAQWLVCRYCVDAGAGDARQPLGAAGEQAMHQHISEKHS